MEIKNKKFYAVSDGKNVLNPQDSLQKVEHQLDKNWPYILELTVTKVFTKNPLVIEVEN